jgi:hypothetical protein
METDNITVTIAVMEIDNITGTVTVEECQNNTVNTMTAVTMSNISQ